MKTLIIVALIIGVIICFSIAICYYNNREAEHKLHPDPKDPCKWWDNEWNEFRKDENNVIF